MTFIDWATRVSTRFLSDRAFELIVGPAIADYEYEQGCTRPIEAARARLAVLRALAGSAWTDLKADSSTGTLFTLTLIPASYFTFMFALCAPRGVRVFSSTEAAIAFVIAVFLLSPIPVIACCWPERSGNPRSQIPNSKSQ
jgi:hypothetical protein